MDFFGKESGAVVDLLSEDSSNIVQLIRDAYEVSYNLFYLDQPKLKVSKYYIVGGLN